MFVLKKLCSKNSLYSFSNICLKIIEVYITPDLRKQTTPHILLIFRKTALKSVYSHSHAVQNEQPYYSVYWW